ncbi:2-octaprenyl-6-methoxyphenyl hydroxylase [Azorhizobium oxalatiphilum]|uniref:2-octaprenyl-6-methoxyphenyl hydroxylase n=1 Tax=Azorhizobium oxalatiphilum TaxID=980631 RepID=A0A917FDM2_9HYPH|nr:UbiH/UbiF family hydroxylase [Azorhizobium oxalatiphilum]GGF73389.1 2-octaprenyl-6-methoxyphenyl hydroxylase [Azorhizobium oxalatiphilum]
MSQIIEAEVAVVGAGPAGLAAAIGFAKAGWQTVLVTGPERGVDHRTTALLGTSIPILERFGVWERLLPHTAPLRDMRIIDGTRRLIRAPEVTFKSSEIGLEAFGYNIENDPLRRTLADAAAEAPNLTLVKASLTDLKVEGTLAHLALDDGNSVATRLVVAADGRQSRVREACGIGMKRREYPQVAVTAIVRHTQPHWDTSIEFHTETGPFTLVPLRGDRSSIVCVVDDREAVRLLGLEPAALAGAMERRAQSVLGSFEVEEGRAAFPLVAETARSITAPRVALMAEAAHIMPPIGAQGLNLGLRDAATLIDLANEAGGEIGGEAMLKRYASARDKDIHGRMTAVDLLNRSLLSDLVPVQGVRGFGLYLLDRITPLRRTVMKLGLGNRAA